MLIAVGTGLLSPTPGAAAGQRPPNIVLVFIDDLGWRDVGFMGNQFIETPALDRLAQEGLVFDQAYASAPNCAPTRACLMSGQYPPRHGIYTVVDPRQPRGSSWHKLMAADSSRLLSASDASLKSLPRTRKESARVSFIAGMEYTLVFRESVRPLMRRPTSKGGE